MAIRKVGFGRGAQATIDDRGLQQIIDRLSRSERLGPVFEALERHAEKIVSDARDKWPVRRGIDGDPTDGVDLVLARGKGDRVFIRKEKRRREHSRDRFTLTRRLTTTALDVVIGNTAPYAFFIRSRQVGETQEQQRARFELRGGDSPQDGWNRQQFGRRRHAWNTLVRTPTRRASRKLADEIGPLLIKIAEK